VDAAVSGAVPDNGQSWIETAVSGPGTLSFWWKVSSQATTNQLEFFIDGIAQTGRVGGNADWRQSTFSVASEFHVLRWLYTTGNGGGAGQTDAGWVDQFVWTPGGTSTANTFASWSEGLPEGKRDWNDLHPLGVANSVIYALGLDPVTATTKDLPGVKDFDPRTGVFIYRYSRRSGLTDAVVNPVVWPGDGALDALCTNAKVETAGERELWEVRIPLALVNQKYLVLKVDPVP
jgi:hypothetical protein